MRGAPEVRDAGSEGRRKWGPEPAGSLIKQTQQEKDWLEVRVVLNLVYG